VHQPHLRETSGAPQSILGLVAPFRTIPFQFPRLAGLIRDREKEKKEEVFGAVYHTYRDCADDFFDSSSFLFLRHYIF